MRNLRQIIKSRKREELWRRRYYQNPVLFTTITEIKRKANRLSVMYLLSLCVTIFLFGDLEAEWNGFVLQINELITGVQRKIRAGNIGVDTWINASVSLISSVLTIIGVFLTIRFEKQRDRKNHMKAIRPILLLSCLDDCLEESVDKSKTEIEMDYSMWDANGFKCSSNLLSIENISDNVAVDIRISLDIYGMRRDNSWRFCKKPIARIDAQSGTVFNMLVKMPCYKEFQWRKIDRYCIPGFSSAVIHLLRDKNSKAIVHNLRGRIGITYRDTMGNEYTQFHDAGVKLLSDSDQYSCIISCDIYPKKIRLNRQNNRI